MHPRIPLAFSHSQGFNERGAKTLFSGEGPWPEGGNESQHSPRAVPRYLGRQPPHPGGNGGARLLSHQAPLTILFSPVSVLYQAGGAGACFGPVTPSEGTSGTHLSLPPSWLSQKYPGTEQGAALIPNRLAGLKAPEPQFCLVARE